MAYAIKVEIRDVGSRIFTFVRQKTMYGGKHIAEGDTIYMFASENEGGRGLVARGVVTSAEKIPRKSGIARQTPCVSIAVNERSGLWADASSSTSANRKTGAPETELNFKFYRQATNKIVGSTDETAAYLDGLF